MKTILIVIAKSALVIVVTLLVRSLLIYNIDNSDGLEFSILDFLILTIPSYYLAQKHKLNKFWKIGAILFGILTVPFILFKIEKMKINSSNG